jgi:cytochrome P450
MGEILEIDLAEFGEEFFQDPPAVYRALREHGPALPVVLPNGWRGWLVTSYEDSRRFLADHRLRKNVNEMVRLFPPGSAAAYGSVLSRHMLNSDPPDHTRLRKLVGKAFTGRAVEQLRPRIEQTGSELLAAMAATAGTPTASPIPGGSTSRASPAATSRSGTAFTTAWARHWPGWRDRSQSGSS